MKVLVIVKATKASEAGIMPDTELLAAMGKYNELLVQAGIMLDGVGLKPSSAGARVRFSGKNRTVVDGPFAETKELMAGFWIWKVKSLQEAIDWVMKCPNPMREDSDIEIRPFFEAEDFGEAFTPELREHEASLRAQSLGLNAPIFQRANERTVIGLNRTYKPETRTGIPRQWDEFVPQISAIPGSQGGDCFGVCWNNTGNCHFDYLTGVEVHQVDLIPTGMTWMSIPAGRYAVFAHSSHVSAIPGTIDTLWSKWGPDCGLKIAGSPFFERYTSEFNPATGMGGIEIWVPLAD